MIERLNHMVSVCVLGKLRDQTLVKGADPTVSVLIDASRLRLRASLEFDNHHVFLRDVTCRLGLIALRELRERSDG